MNVPYYRIPDSVRINRRSFLLTTTSLAAAAVWSSRALGGVVRGAKFQDYPFQLGVASGDPAPDGVVLWTRLAPKPLEFGGGMPMESVEVSWQVAEDEQMTRVVQQGTTVANPDWAHSVHVEVEGLRPDRWYWYQFKAGSEVSPKGRTRTMPLANTLPERMRFAFASCQHYEYGYYTAFDHMAAEDLDLIVHLGDYIYEYKGADNRVRRHPNHEIKSLEEYRLRFAVYKSDESLKRAHAAAPWIVTWDDHEVDNDYAAGHSEEKKVTTEELLARRAVAYKAYYEHMPLRRSALPQGPDMQLYRRLAYGRLADFHVLDTRQYRTPQPCGNGNKPPCDEAINPDATLLGAAQRDWLFKGMIDSPAEWNILAQQVMMARVDRKVGEDEAYSMDQWPGYEIERRRILNFLEEAKIRNPVVLTGDIHTNYANELLVDFDNLESRNVGTEFVGTSISSGGDGTANPKNLERFLSENPFVKFHNAERGYVRCEVTPDAWRTDYRSVPFVTKPGAQLNTRASFLVESGRPRLERI